MQKTKKRPLEREVMPKWVYALKNPEIQNFLMEEKISKKQWQKKKIRTNTSVSSVTQSCPTLWEPMDCSTPGFPVHQQLPELAQTHVHWIGNDIQPSHPLLSPFPPAFNLCQHQGFFKWIGSLHQVAKVIGASASILPMNIQDWFPLGLTGLISLQKGILKSLLQHHSLKASILWCSTL